MTGDCRNPYHDPNEDPNTCFWRIPTDLDRRVEAIAKAFCDCGAKDGEPHETEERNCQYIDLMEWLPPLVEGARRG